MKDGDSVSAAVLRKSGPIVEWRKDREWGEKDGPAQTILKFVELQNVLHGFE